MGSAPSPHRARKWRERTRCLEERKMYALHERWLQIANNKHLGFFTQASTDQGVGWSHCGTCLALGLNLTGLDLSRTKGIILLCIHHFWGWENYLFSFLNFRVIWTYNLLQYAWLNNIVLDRLALRADFLFGFNWWSFVLKNKHSNQQIFLEIW